MRLSYLCPDVRRRNNVGKDCEGVGVRLGGSEVDDYQYGQENDVRFNIGDLITTAPESEER